MKIIQQLDDKVNKELKKKRIKGLLVLLGTQGHAHNKTIHTTTNACSQTVWKAWQSSTAPNKQHKKINQQLYIVFFLRHQPSSRDT